MPTYEYECSGCELVFEEERPITAPARQRCPQCRHKVRRIISGGSGILFKGSGFYITDSRGKSGDGKAPPTTPPASGSSGETTSSGD
ncbi:FmdB family transcriptional regulator [bacterium CG17_big_fil_post_rev_8_21_14_2_50_64_8]|nr:MAG: FmdB family transcriptional regulator [bacterium CG17_big_fil_post_rev_8_21_14_2_50_64_8]PJA74306.1 MAG: FmdB family transcriptional regulator [bacterium CG_4_9_14_3_um_filter_65_15]